MSLDLFGDLTSAIDDIKTKISDQEYRDIMDDLKTLHDEINGDDTSQFVTLKGTRTMVKVLGPEEDIMFRSAPFIWTGKLVFDELNGLLIPSGMQVDGVNVRKLEEVFRYYRGEYGPCSTFDWRGNIYVTRLDTESKDICAPEIR